MPGKKLRKVRRKEIKACRSCPAWQKRHAKFSDFLFGNLRFFSPRAFAIRIFIRARAEIGVRAAAYTRAIAFVRAAAFTRAAIGVRAAAFIPRPGCRLPPRHPAFSGRKQNLRGRSELL